MSTYDEKLLASAPQATKAQLQGGYNPDLLVEKPSSSTPATPPVDIETPNRVPTSVQQHESASLTKKKTPFYATKKGMIIIGVVAFVIVVIVAVVGGVVGSRNKNSLNVVATSSSVGNGVMSTSISTSHTSSSGVQEGGPSASGGGQGFGTNFGTPTITQGTASTQT